MKIFKNLIVILVFSTVFLTEPTKAMSEDVFKSVVSILPVWPNRLQGGGVAPVGTAPEGSGIAILKGGFIATAAHVVKPASRVDVRLHDGRILPARLVGLDQASDIALLKIDEALPLLEASEMGKRSDRVCAIGNAFGLDLSVSCGVISALHVSNAGFNPVEDFVQTDAAVNPGSSGGALVDGDGRLVGMLSAIFASKQGDANVGINFAVSTALLKRVIEDLKDNGTVSYVNAGWSLAILSRKRRIQYAGVTVRQLETGGAADRAGFKAGDIIIHIGKRSIKKPRDVISVVSHLRVGDSVEVQFIRNDELHRLQLSFAAPKMTDNIVSDAANTNLQDHQNPDCPHPAPVCLARQAVFPIESYDPIASAVRIGDDLMVTNRHVVGDHKSATVLTPDGPRKAEIIASSYRGDLALLKVEGLPVEGVRLSLDRALDIDFTQDTFYAVGADISRQEIRVFRPGRQIIPLSKQSDFARLHVTSVMQPGVSGGALLNQDGLLAGIAVGGGEGRFEALPAHQINLLLSHSTKPDATRIQNILGHAYVRCNAALDAARDTPRGRAHAKTLVEVITEECLVAENPGQLVEAGRALGVGRATDEAIRLHEFAVNKTPHSINARLSLLISLQLGGRFREILPHAQFLLNVLPEAPQVLRFAIQSGVWGGNVALAERAYDQLLKVNPGQAQAARRFIDNAPPAPPRR